MSGAARDYALEVAEHYQAEIAHAISALVDVRRLLSAAPVTGEQSAAAARLVRDATDPEAVRRLARLIGHIHDDAYGAGVHAAYSQLSAAGIGQPRPPAGHTGEQSTDWDAWSPGTAGRTIAKAWIPGSGKARLGPRADQAASEIAGTWSARLRGTLARLWGRGRQPGTGDLPNPAVTARTVAQTEADTASVLAKADTYGANGVTRYRWITSAGACKRCAPLAGVFNLGDGRLPPLHPNCRCDVQPETQPAPGVTVSLLQAIEGLTGIAGMGAARLPEDDLADLD